MISHTDGRGDGVTLANDSLELTVTDVTARVEAERELARLNLALAQQSGERQALVRQLLTAQEDERRTVAYELHDGPAQQLAAGSSRAN